MEIFDNRKGCAWVANHQKNIQGVSKGAKAIFFVGNRKNKRKTRINGKLLNKNKRSDKKARINRDEIGEIKKRNRFF